MSVFYLDYDLGNDSTTATPLGWWSVAYTGGTAPAPAADEVVTGASSGSTAKLTVVVAPTGGSWAGNNASGTMYFYGKSAAFQSEQVNCAGGGHFHITSDFTYCAWKTLTLGATAARIAPGDTIRLTKSPTPYSIGSATWTTTTTVGGGFPATKNISSSTNATPIVMTVTSHGYVNGDVVQVIGHTTNTAANGAWIVANKTDNTFELEGSVGNGIGTAVGTVQLINSKAVKLSTAQTTDVNRCEGAPNMVVNGTFTGSATGWTLNTGWAYGSNAVTHSSGGGTGVMEPSTPLTVVSGASYYVIYTITSYSSGSVTVSIGGANGTSRSSAATFSEVITTTGTGNLQFTPSNDFAGTIDTVEVYFGPWIAANSSTVAAVATATDAKEGGYCTSVTKSSYSTSTLYAYCPIPTTDFSSRYKLSFWFKNSAAVLGTHWVVKLCSDNAGVTAVDTFTIPAIPSTTRWVPLTIAKDGGGTLGSSIKSIAIYSGSVAPTSASTIYVDNFIACASTDGLNLQSLVSTNSAEQAGTEGWYPIQSINGKVILIDNDTLTKSNAGRGWSGTTTTATTYARETIKTAMAATAFEYVQQFTDPGSYGNVITYSGGWDSSNNTRTGETYFDGLNGNGYGVGSSGTVSYLSLIGVSVARYYNGVNLGYSGFGGYGTFDISNATGCYGGVVCQYSVSTITIRNANNNNQVGITVGIDNNTLIVGNANNNTSSGGVYVGGFHNIISSVTNANNNTYGISLNTAYSAVVENVSSAKYNTYGLYVASGSKSKIFGATLDYNSYDLYSSAGADNYMYDCVTGGNSTSEYTGGTAYPEDGKLFSQRHDNTDDNHWIFNGMAVINSVTDSNRHTLSGLAWKLRPSSSYRNSTQPITLAIGKVACAGSGTVTVSAWVKKSHATNVGAKLRCKGKQIAGEDSDKYSSEKANDTNYEQLSITLSPSAVGVVEIECLAWTNNGTADSVYVDDFSVTQT